MTNNDFDRLLDSIRESEPDAAAVKAASARVRDRLATGAASELCTSFRVDFAAYRAGTLGEARHMLLEDHLHTCVACRTEYSGSSHAAVLPMRTRPVWLAMKWAMAAAAAVAVVWAAIPLLDRTFAPSGPRGTVASLEGSLVLVSGQGTTALQPGSTIDEGQEVRTGQDSHAVIRLRDGSLVEMAERSELSVTELWRSKTVHLEQGNVIVEAAKQGRGRLEVATADCLVTVKGTIFSVSNGLKGSRISVVEGSVQVDQASGGGTLLKRGDQAITHESIERTSVATDVSWSQNAAKYLALLADLDAVQREISRIPMPGLRYTSRLLDRVPANADIVAAVPNLSQTLAEATRIMDDHARRSPALGEWWNRQGGEVRMVIDKVREVADYLGEEIVITARNNGEPLVLAEVRRQGLVERLAQLGFNGPVAIDGSVVALGATTVPPVGTFTSTPFGARIAESYRAGVGLLFAANAEHFVHDVVPTSNVNSEANILGLDNLRFVIAESKTNLGANENTASFTFSGARHGIASWLDAPGPMGTLEFVSPQASFATSLVTRDPRMLLEELLNAVGPGSTSFVTEFQRETNVNPLDDIAGALGGEMTVAIDGALLPVPSWKVAIEVQSPARLQTAIETLVSAVHTHIPDSGVALSTATVNNRTYYTLSTTVAMATQVNYTYVDGYLLAAATRPLLDSAISNRSAGLTLPRSQAFRAQMPLDGHNNFSAIFYYNLGSAVGPLADQLKGLLTPEQQASVAAMTANRAPSLIYVYGERDRILVGSRSGLLDMGLQALTGLASGHIGGLLPVTGLGGPQ